MFALEDDGHSNSSFDFQIRGEQQVTDDVVTAPPVVVQPLVVEPESVEHAVSPQCMLDLQDVAMAGLILNPKNSNSTNRESAIALTAAALCFHLTDDPSFPLACHSCIHYRATIRVKPGNPAAPAYIPSIVHQAGTLKQNLAWLHKSIDHALWSDTTDMGTWKARRGTILRVIAPGGPIDRALGHVLTLVKGVEHERRQRELHRVAVQNLCMGYTRCTSFTEHGTTVAATPATTATDAATAKSSLKRTRNGASKNRGRISECAKFLAESCDQEQPTAETDAAQHIVPPRQTLVVLQELFNQNEDLCRILNACCCLLAVGHASTGVHAPDGDAVSIAWGTVGRKSGTPETFQHAFADMLLERIARVLEEATSEQGDLSSNVFPRPVYTSVLASRDCKPRADYNKPSGNLTGMGFTSTTAFEQVAVTNVRSVLQYAAINRPSGGVQDLWFIIMPTFISSIITILHDYAALRLVKFPLTGTQEHETGMRGVLERVLSERTSYFQRAVDYMNHGSSIDTAIAALLLETVEPKRDTHIVLPY